MLALTRRVGETVFIEEIRMTVGSIQMSDLGLIVCLRIASQQPLLVKTAATVVIGSQHVEVQVRKGQVFTINKRIRIKLSASTVRQVRLGIEAPPEMHILRAELHEQQQEPTGEDADLLLRQ